MAFKKIQPSPPPPDSPEKLFHELPRRKIPDVLPHQRELMRLYVSEAQELLNVALECPTGSGKTLVGLLIAEWRRRKYQERIIYLCPTRQLVNQVVEQAEEKYGLTVLGFTGSKNDYSPTAKTSYRNADQVAVTTYSSLFNIHPFFDDADIIIIDDVHAAESYISKFWSVRIGRNGTQYSTLHTVLQSVLKPLLSPLQYARLSGQVENSADQMWIDKVPTPKFAEIADEITEILDEHTQGTNLAYPWSIIRDHLHACHFYLSSHEMLIRPLIPPTWTHAPFHNAKQRIYMSATLGAGGDLERVTGCHGIHYLQTLEGWDQRGVGRRFFIFPSMSLEVTEILKLRYDMMHLAGRSLVLVPSDRMRDDILDGVQKNLDFGIFGAEDIEHSKKPFISSSKAVAIVANRYDGIDFPGDECRLLFIEGLPKATNLQERFLMARMGANILFNERIQVRVLQAIGRCTRSLEDYSAVVISGDELVDYLADIRRRKFLHPEFQAEIQFGVEQSTNASTQDMVENFKIFLENGKDWEEVNQEIVSSRKCSVQESFLFMDQLRNVVEHEIYFQKRLWQGDYMLALDCAEHVLAGLAAPELRGYRALWHYLAGSVAWFGARTGISCLSSKSREQFVQAKNAAVGIPWLATLANNQIGEPSNAEEDPILMEQIERVEGILTRFGIVHDRKFSSREKEILEGLRSSDKSIFEQAHKFLGELLGFNSDNVETEGSPDPWWIVGSVCFVFEDHAGAQSGSTLDVKKARQVSSHPDWVRSNIEASAGTEILAVLITPVKKVRQAATPHLGKVALWPLHEFRDWAVNALTTIREIRRTFVESGDLMWRATAAEAFERNDLSAQRLYKNLQSKPVVQNLEVVK